jgi:amino acid transporter
MSRPHREGPASGVDGAPRATATTPATPRQLLGTMDAVALIVGTVVGAGIFRTPPLVAANAGSESLVLVAWLVGGVVSLVGALCYAELATTYPNTGGDYHFLARAYGPRLAFLFAWSRITVIQTGSIALLAYVLGAYASQLYPLGPYSSAVYAAGTVLVLTTVNAVGLRQSRLTQNTLTLAEVAGLLLVVGAGVAAAAAPASATAGAATPPGPPAFGLVMVFVLLTYGGWNEAAYVSAEMRDPSRTIVRSLVLGIAVVTTLYVLVNWACLTALGLAGTAASKAVAAELVGRGLGAGAAQLVSVLVVISALTSANATILTGARSGYAFGRDFPRFALLGRWDARANSPVRALWVQGALALGLVGLGALTRTGFETMVEYTAPVFWLFFLLTGFALFVLRRAEPNVPRPFRVPLYPITPLVFCATSAYLLYASLNYTGIGALVGVAVLLAGALALLAGAGRTHQGGV